MVTVVVPVYNVAAYLGEAVESVLAQTCPHWEMILVDDGSTDSSGHMCDAWAERDGRIRVIHKENGGLASARNAGLDAARGEWVMFLDSDDFWQDTMLERMLAAADGADVVCCGLRFFPEKGPEDWVDRAYSFDSFRGVAERAAYFYTRNCINSACTKLYRRESIRYRFDESLRHAEDLIFNLEYLPHARGIRFIPDILYHYRQEAGTLGQRFWADMPEISARTWRMSREIFAGVPEALAYFDKRYVYEISKHLVILSRMEGLPEIQRLLVAQMYLSEPLLQEACFLMTPKTEAAARLWELIRRGDAQGVFAQCRQEDVLGFVWEQGR